MKLYTQRVWQMVESSNFRSPEAVCLSFKDSLNEISRPSTRNQGEYIDLEIDGEMVGLGGHKMSLAHSFPLCGENEVWEPTIWSLIHIF